jgi:F-type H+-transporting ATPase subunit b
MDLHHIINTVHAAEEAAAQAHNTGVLDMFGINLKLFIAQLVNFAIVLLVLWKWVFTPVSKALEARTAKIEKSLKDARQITEDKETFETWKNAEISKVRQEAAGIITQAKQESEALKNQMAAETRAEQEKIVKQAHNQMESDKERALTEIKTKVADMVVGATETILREKIDAKKDAALIKEALQKVNA